MDFNFYPKLEKNIKIYDLFKDLPDDVLYLVLIPKIFKDSQKEKSKTKKALINWILFIITLIMVLFSGYIYIYIFDPIYGGPYSSFIESIIYIILFSVAILGIIAAHEFGHYFVLKKYNLGPSMPYFIPGIPPLGTFGAFVNQKLPAKNRNQLFDIGYSGPIAGFIISIVCVLIGFLFTRPIPTNEFLQAYVQTHNTYFDPISLSEAARKISENFNNYNLFIYLLRYYLYGAPTYSYYYGTLLPDYIIQIHPLTFCGWIGMLVTAINSLPAGKLDGGHIARAIFGKYYWIGTIIGVIILFFIDYYLIFLLILLGGLGKHEGPLNDIKPISINRIFAYFVLIIIIIFSIPLSPLYSIFGVL